MLMNNRSINRVMADGERSFLVYHGCCAGEEPTLHAVKTMVGRILSWRAFGQAVTGWPGAKFM